MPVDGQAADGARGEDRKLANDLSVLVVDDRCRIEDIPREAHSYEDIPPEAHNCVVNGKTRSAGPSTVYGLPVTNEGDHP